jgi:hypothetical protein
MVKGLELFRERLREFEKSYILIGGAACDEWFAALNRPFRATKDLDIVLIVEVVDRPFVAALRVFIADGKYEIRQRTAGTPILYRFAKPKNDQFPFMLELFSRRPRGVQLESDQEITPVPVGSGAHSLSAILLDDNYYSLIQTHRDVRDGLPAANVTALIPLKARAWLDLTRCSVAGDKIDSKDIAKHRNDVFRLAGRLPGIPGPDLPANVKTDLSDFLARFDDSSAEWPSMLAAIKSTLGGIIRPATLRQAIQTYFRLPAA